MKFHPSPFWQAVINDDDDALVEAVRAAPIKHIMDGSEVEPTDAMRESHRHAHARHARLVAEGRPPPHGPPPDLAAKIGTRRHAEPIRREDHLDENARRAHDMVERLLAAGRLRKVLGDDGHHYEIRA